MIVSAQELTESDVVAFQGVYRKHFDVQLDHNTAKRKLTQLVQLVELIYKPTPEQGGDQ